MKTLIRRELETSRRNELKALTKEKQWTAALLNTIEWPKLEPAAEFRLRTGHDCLVKHLYRIGVYTQPTCSLRPSGGNGEDLSDTVSYKQRQKPRHTGKPEVN
nr:hypothetical transcript [Hymenolepis microstoma]